MKLNDFEQELLAIDPNLGIRPNQPHKVFPELEKLAAVTYMGTELFTIPNFEIFDEPNANYGVDVRGDGKFIVHRTRLQALDGVKDKLEQLKNKDYSDAFFGRGEYSDASLRGDHSAKQEIVEEVAAELVEVEGKEEIKHPLKEIGE